MVAVPDKVIDIVKKFIEEAEKDNIRISQAVIFGSYAKGTNHKFSDIDLAVVSDAFEGISFYDNKKLTKAMLRTSIDIETHTYLPDEFNENNPFVKEILEYGVRVI